jgi:hypothetical protein
MVLSVRMRIQ